MVKLRYGRFLLELNKFWVHSFVLTTLIYYVLLTIKLFMEFKQLMVSFGLFAALICYFWVWDWVLKQLRVLLMYIYKFPFLCFAPNQFLHGVFANVENFYRRTDTVRYRSSLPELKKSVLQTELSLLVYNVYNTYSCIYLYRVSGVLKSGGGAKSLTGLLPESQNYIERKRSPNYVDWVWVGARTSKIGLAYYI